MGIRRLVPPLVFLLVFAVGCAARTRSPSLKPPRTGMVATDLSAVVIAPGADLLIRSATGETIHGKFVGMTANDFELNEWDAFAGMRSRVVPRDGVAVVARVVGNAKGRRGWIGAAIGAAVSAPFGVSMVGDMVLPAALVGALVGRATAGTHAEVLYQRP